MVDVVTFSPILRILPVISFLFVFILVYAVLAKTQVLGENKTVAVFLSLIVASFFIINSQLVEFVNLSTGWVAMFIVCLFFILLFTKFGGGSEPKDALGNGGKNITFVLVAILLILFVVASSYVFNWAVNWDMLKSWFDKPWFGTVVLIIFAAIVAFVLTKSGAPAGGGDKKGK